MPDIKLSHIKRALKKMWTSFSSLLGDQKTSLKWANSDPRSSRDSQVLQFDRSQAKCRRFWWNDKRDPLWWCGALSSREEKGGYCIRTRRVTWSYCVVNCEHIFSCGWLFRFCIWSSSIYGHGDNCAAYAEYSDNCAAADDDDEFSHIQPNTSV